jgi:hypothetical protein
MLQMSIIIIYTLKIYNTFIIKVNTEKILFLIL